jgi:hypothetical protein|tara:strand:- start:162 stop:464 length:303 start_codon:yes stop_codon:yes gene_type:complete
MEQGTNQKYIYPFKYCNSRQLCEQHGITYKTLERWISEAKAEGKTIPGIVPIPGVRSYIWDPIIFHDQYLLPKINGPVRNEYEQRDHLLIINNLKKRKVS